MRCDVMMVNGWKPHKHEKNNIKKRKVDENEILFAQRLKVDSNLKTKKKTCFACRDLMGQKMEKIIINQNNGDNLKRTFWYQKNKIKLKRNIKKKLRQQVDLKRFFSPFSSSSLPLLLRVSLLFLCFLPYKSSLPLWFLLIFVIFFLIELCTSSS